MAGPASLFVVRENATGRSVGQVLLSGDLIFGLCVDPVHRRRGVARCLLARAVRTALSELGEREVQLFVDSENLNAVSLYESTGFSRTGAVEYWRIW